MGGLDIRAASTAAQKLRLDNIGTLSLEARLYPTPIAPSILDYELPQCVARLVPQSEGSDVMHVIMTMCVEFKGDGGPVGRVAVDYIAQYTVLTPLSLEEGESFAGISTFMHCFPYFRADVQAMTAKLALPALTLPTVTSGYVTEERVKVEVLAPPPPQPAATTNRKRPRRASKKPAA